MTFQSLKENIHPQIWIKEMKIVDYLMIGATIRIGQDILCLPYVWDFYVFLHNTLFKVVITAIAFFFFTIFHMSDFWTCWL